VRRIPLCRLQWPLQRLRARCAAKLIGNNLGHRSDAGVSIPIQRFFIAQPTDSAEIINLALLFGFDLILTPGIYNLDRSIEIWRPDTVVLGLGYSTLIPTNGNASMTVAEGKGTLISESSLTRARTILPCCCR